MLKIATIFKKASPIKETPAQTKKNVNILSPSLNQNLEPDLLTIPQQQNLTSSRSSLNLEENQNLEISPDVNEELYPRIVSEMVKENEQNNKHECQSVKKNKAETNLNEELNGKLNPEDEHYPTEEKKNKRTRSTVQLLNPSTQSHCPYYELKKSKPVAPTRKKMYFEENRELIPDRYKLPPSPLPKKRRKITSLKKDNRKMTGNVNIYICSESTENPVKKTQQSKKKSLKTSSERTMAASASNDTSYFSSTDTSSNKLLKDQPQDTKKSFHYEEEKMERNHLEEDFSVAEEHKIGNKLLCLCKKSKKDSIREESSSNLVCLCDNASFNNLQLKPSELSGSEDSISSGLKMISSHVYNRESSLKSYKRLGKYDSKILCRCCDIDLKSDKNDEFKEEKIEEKRDHEETDKVDETNADRDEKKSVNADEDKDKNREENQDKNQETNKDKNNDTKQDLIDGIKITEEGYNSEKNVEEKEFSEEIETNLITRDQSNSKKIRSSGNSPNVNNYRRFVKQCSSGKKGLSVDPNQNLSTVAENISDKDIKKKTLISVETSAQKYLSAFQRRNLISQTCAAKESKITAENLQEENSQKSTLLQQSLQKAHKLLFKSKLGTAIARRKGLNYFSKEDHAKLDSKEEQKVDDTREDKKTSDSKQETKIGDSTKDQNSDNSINDQKTFDFHQNQKDGYSEEDQKTGDSRETKNLQDSNIFDKKIPQECDCCSCNKNREGKSDSSPKNWKLDGNLQRSRIKCCYNCEQLGTDHFSSEKSKMKIRCCHRQRFEKNSRQVEVDNDQSIHYEKSVNITKCVCRCQRSPKAFHNSEREEKQKKSQSKSVKYSNISRPLCVCSQKANEKAVHQNLIEKCSYCNLPTNICNCEDPLEIVDSEEESHLLKKSSKSKPHGSEILPYQRLSVFSDVMNELQQKISGSVCCHLCRKEPCCCCCCCLQENVGDNEKRKAGKSNGRKTIICPAIQEEHSIIEKDKRKSLVQSDNCNYVGDRNHGLAFRICDICRTSPCRCRRSKSTYRKQLKAKCYYCKNSPCTCIVSKEKSTHKLCSCCEGAVLSELEKDLRSGKLSPKN